MICFVSLSLSFLSSRYYNTSSNPNNSVIGDDDEGVMTTTTTTGGDQEPGVEANFDAYEYDDEFEIADGQSKLQLDDDDDDDDVRIVTDGGRSSSSSNAYTALNSNIQFGVLNTRTSPAHTFENLKSRSMKKIRRLRDGLSSLAVASGPASTPRDLLKSGLRKFPPTNSFYYNSTDSTYANGGNGNGGGGMELSNRLVLDGVGLATLSSSSSSSSASAAARTPTMVIYDSKKRNVTASATADPDAKRQVAEETNNMRLAMNPMDELETVENKTKTTQ